MKNVPVLYGQTIIDIAIQELGDGNRAFELAQLNNISISDDLNAGQVIVVPDYDLANRYLVQLFSNPSNKPASGDNLSSGVLADVGIGYWALEVDFVVQ
jgi:hypothetical protein